MEQLVERVLYCLSNAIKEQRFMKDYCTPLITQFRSVNKSGKYDISFIPFRCDIYHTKVYLYALESFPEGGISNSQVYNMNLNSGYSVSTEIDDDTNESLVCNVFFNKEFLTSDIKTFDEAKTGRFLLNIRYSLLNIIRTAYPAMKDNLANIAATVCAVVIANKLGLAITPTMVAHYFELNPQMGEMVIDKYDYEKNQFVGIPWLF